MFHTLTFLVPIRLTGRYDACRKRGVGTFLQAIRISLLEDVMKAYLNNLSTGTWLLVVVPAIAVAYPVVRIVVPCVIRAVVPEVVRTVISVI